MMAPHHHGRNYVARFTVSAQQPKILPFRVSCHYYRLLFFFCEQLEFPIHRQLLLLIYLTTILLSRVDEIDESVHIEIVVLLLHSVNCLVSVYE